MQDLGSTNGTRVARALRQGGEPLPLEAGESFHIGPFFFVVLARGRGDDPSISGDDALRVVDPMVAGVPDIVRDIAGSAVSVLILGETGVGKEVLADTLHQLSGRSGVLTRINCAALARDLPRERALRPREGGLLRRHRRAPACSSRPAAAPSSRRDRPAPSAIPDSPPAEAAPPGPAADWLDPAQQADRDKVLRALEECAGNQSRAAKLRLYRIPRPRS